MRRYRPQSSWPVVLTDWCVIQALEHAGCPDCLRNTPSLFPPLVSALSAALRLKIHFDRLGEVTALLDAAAESAYERVLGHAYVELRANRRYPPTATTSRATTTPIIAFRPTCVWPTPARVCFKVNWPPASAPVRPPMFGQSIA